MHRVLLLAGAGLSLLFSTALCRYTIRDVAFVDLGGDGWTLRAEVPEGAPGEWTTTLKRIARASLADTNVQLIIAEGEKDSALTTSLVAPDGRTLVLDLPQDPDALARHGWDELDAVASSAARDRFRARCLEIHAAVVVFDGKDAADNLRVRGLAKEAISQSLATLAELPKPASAPPEILAVAFSDRRKERVLHWATGADEEEADDAHVVVLYGRGRRMGPVLAGPVITASAIRQALLLIGQDCECELPRSIMRGSQIPLTWGKEQSDRAQQVLGFDGRNPMVKQEIARIVAREATSPNAPDVLGVDPLGLGYHEDEIVSSQEITTQPPGETLGAGDQPEPVVASWIVIASTVILVVVGLLVAFLVFSARSRK
ncbi:MAG: hypothetical protein HRU14_07195 [Planctomycetes bacterium]|nr:hypothetical protein [Planctomycetota bacterium]